MQQRNDATNQTSAVNASIMGHPAKCYFASNCRRVETTIAQSCQQLRVNRESNKLLCRFDIPFDT
jgi:hypothetical protein